MLFTCANCHEELLAVSSKKPWVLEGVRVKVSEACLHKLSRVLRATKFIKKGPLKLPRRRPSLRLGGSFCLKTMFAGHGDDADDTHGGHDHDVLQPTLQL